MPKIVSSYSKIMLSLLSKKMPELSKYTNEHSTNNLNKNPDNKQSKPSSTLSSQQIQEAVLHPSSIMQQALKVTSEIQKALNDHNLILDEIAQKRAYIKASLLKLQMNDPMPKDKNDNIIAQKDNKIKELIYSLNNELADLMALEQEILEAKNKLDQERSELDKAIQTCEKEWRQHRELYFSKLEEELKMRGLILNTAEKNELRQGSNNISSIEQKLTNLKKLAIDIENKESDFSVLAYNAIVTILSRELKVINNKTVGSIAENVRTIIREEKNVADAMKKKHANYYEQIISNIHSLKTQEAKLEQNLDKKDEVLDSIESKIKLIAMKK